MRRIRNAAVATVVVAASLLLAPGAGYAAPTVDIAAESVGRPTQAIEPDQVDACGPNDRGRFADCKSRIFSWNLRKVDPKTGPIVGTAMASMTISEVTAWDSREWTAHYTARLISLDGEAEVGTTAAIVTECRGTCTVLSGGNQPAQPVSDNSIISGDIRFSSDGGPITTSSQVISLHLFNPTAVGSGTTAGTDWSVLGPVRCDDGNQRYGIEGRAGCVLENFDPTFVINSPEFPHDPAPQHAAFVAAAQVNPKTQNLGRPGFGKPLIREYMPKPLQDKKRRAVTCSFQRNPSPAGAPRKQLDTCDEYPYSSSRQGVPEFAVTEHVPNGDNVDGGRRLLSFYARYHVMDGNAYYVQP